MAFNSLGYFLFLGLSFLLYGKVPDRLRWLVLLAASYGFYAALKAPQLPLLLALVTAVSYVCGLGIADSREPRRRALFFWGGVAGCLAALVALKYLPALLGPGPFRGHPRLLISIGVSYFTFQAISYLADLYLEIVEPERHPGRHALALAFFPKLLQGPIERAGDLLPQLEKPYRFDYLAVRSGLTLFAWGLFKKVVLADRLALYADTVFNDLHAYRGAALGLATYLYALQIYFDFAGYTDMARGSARLFGIELTRNFNAPYLATSVADFWRRWHMSFSRWILDYIFKPLQMAWRDRGKGGTALALLVTFLVSGVWHGATWGFVAWGALHGVYLAGSTFYKPYQKRLYKRLGIEKSPWLKWWQMAVTFHLVCFAWIFFRAQSFADALYLVRNLAAGAPAAGSLSRMFATLPAGNLALTVALGLAVIWGENRTPQLLGPARWEGSAPLRWACYYLLICGMILLGVSSQSQFIYFKF